MPAVSSVEVVVGGGVTVTIFPDSAAAIAGMSVSVIPVEMVRGERWTLAALDLLVLVPITPETERVLPAAEMLGLRRAVDDAVLELAYADPLHLLADVPVVELSVPLAGSGRDSRHCAPVSVRDSECGITRRRGVPASSGSSGSPRPASPVGSSDRRRG